MILLTNHRDLVPQFLGLTVRHLIFGQIVDNTIKRRKKELIEFTEIASLPLIFTSSWIHMLLDKEDRTNINILIYIYIYECVSFDGNRIFIYMSYGYT